jgi:transmembrane sensor
MNIELITKYLANSASPDETLEVLKWVETSEENKQLFADLKNAWALANMVSYPDQITRNKDLELILRKIKKNLNIDHRNVSFFNHEILKNLQRIAATILITAGIVGYFGYRIWSKPQPIAFNVLSVPAGQFAQLTLGDGTKIWLNSKSILTYPSQFSGSNREIKLNGEAFFEVSPNKEKPFIVKTKELDVAVLGTDFDVSAYQNDRNINVTLVNGSVNLLNKKDNSEIAKLKPGEQASYSISKNTISISSVETQLYTSWRTGQIKFRKMSFEEIAKRLSRNYNIEFKFENANMLSTTYNGSFYKYESLDQILKIMQANSHFNYTIEKDTIYIR